MPAKKHEDLTEKELTELKRKKNVQNRSYKWEKTISLTLEEGSKLESDFFPEFDCANVSQLVKKIVKGELSVTPSDLEQ